MRLVQCLLALLTFRGDDSNWEPVALPVSVARENLYREFVAVRLAEDNHSKALHFYLLNNAADQYAYSLNKRFPGSGESGADLLANERKAEWRVQDANQHGASIQLCEYSGLWTDQSHGYEAYLSLWPNGPYAEEAWWRSRFPNPNKLNQCYDGVGSEEEAARFVHAYSEFLRHFPRGKHANQARESLRWWEGQ